MGIDKKSIRIATLRAVALFVGLKNTVVCKLKRKPNVFCLNRLNEHKKSLEPVQDSFLFVKSAKLKCLEGPVQGLFTL